MFMRRKTNEEEKKKSDHGDETFSGKRKEGKEPEIHSEWQKLPKKEATLGSRTSRRSSELAEGGTSAAVGETRLKKKDGERHGAEASKDNRGVKLLHDARRRGVKGVKGAEKPIHKKEGCLRKKGGGRTREPQHCGEERA